LNSVLNSVLHLKTFVVGSFVVVQRNLILFGFFFL
jgi:hypothetical protein